MSNKKFDELFHEEEIVEFDKKIKRNINKKVYLRIAISLLIVCLMIVGFYKGVNLVIDSNHYDPFQEERFLKNDKKGYEFQTLMTNYYQMLHPGSYYIYAYNEDGPSIESQGFGQYTFKARIQSTLEPVCMGPEENATFKIEKSTLAVESLDKDIYSSRVVDEFINPGNKKSRQLYDLKDIKKELESLPDSSYIQASVSFEHYKTMKEIVELSKNDKYSINWIALKDQELFRVDGIAGGMSLLDTYHPDFTDEFNEKYPNYILESYDTLTAQELKQNYLSKLKLLIDHPEFIKIFNNNISVGTVSVQQLQENYEKAQKEMLAYGVHMNIHKNELLDMVENDDVSQVYIHDIKLSQFQR